MRLDELLRILFENPLLLIVLIGWIAGAIGKVVQVKRKVDTARRRAEPQGGAAPSSQRPARTAEEVAAEMRRILGMDGPSAAPARPTPPAVEVRPVPVRREATEGDLGPQPLRPARLGNVQVHVDPHVGESVQRRAAPVSGQVTGHSLGTLGGRAAVARTAGTARRRFAGLEDLERAMVLREVLDAPRALRGWDR